MKDIKVVHTCDWHFRKKDFEEINKCVGHIVYESNAIKPDLFCISGDITDSRNLGLDSDPARAILHIISDMLNIAPVAIVIGTPSHDGHTALALRELRGKYPILVSDMPGQYIFDAGLDVSTGNHGRWISVDDINNASFRADFILTQIPQPTKQYFINDLSIEDTEKAIGNAMGTMLAAFGYKAALLNGVPHIANGHGQIGGAFISDTQQLTGHDIEVSKAQLKALNAVLICYGHIHKAQDMGDGIFYAGSPTRMNHGETENKGFYLHTIGDMINANTDDIELGLKDSEFIKTPAIKLLEIKEDFTKEKSDISDLDMVLHTYGPEDLKECSLKITLTMWQDDALNINQEGIKKSFLDAGCSVVKFALIRKPRETVRAERVLAAETLPEKIEAMAELRGEKVSNSILEKAASIEAGDTNPWVKEVKNIDDVKEFLDKPTENK